MFKLVAYRMDNKGVEMARFEQKFHVLEALKTRFNDLRDGFPNYEIFKNERLIETNMGQIGGQNDGTKNNG